MYLHYLNNSNNINNMIGGSGMHIPNREEAMGFFHKHEMKIGGLGIVCCCISLVMTFVFKNLENETADPKKKKNHNTAFWIFLSGAIFYCGIFCFALGTIMHS